MRGGTTETAESAKTVETVGAVEVVEVEAAGAAGADPVAADPGDAPPPRPAVLYASTSRAVTFAEAVAAAGLRSGAALLAAPAEYHVARLADGGSGLELRLARPHPDGRVEESAVTLGADGGPPGPLGDVFEARLFDGTAELRWLNERDGLGRAVLLSEDPAVAGRLAEPLAPVDAVDTIDNRYLVWGRPVRRPAAVAEAVPDGWALLAEARIGALAVPLDGGQPAGNRYVYLHAVEYVAADGSGNCAVVEERLSHLAAASPGWGRRRFQPSTGERP